MKVKQKKPTTDPKLNLSRLHYLGFNEDKIIKIIRALDIEKAHAHDHFSNRMIKICNKSLSKLLIILLENSTKSSCYPDILKRFDVIVVHKTSDKQLVKNYQPLSLLPIFCKIFKKIILKKL